MGISIIEKKRERQYIAKKGCAFLIKDMWIYKDELILYGKVEEGLVTDRTPFQLPRANGKTVKAYPISLQYDERDHVPYPVSWAYAGAPVILRFKKTELRQDVRVRRWQTIRT